MTPPPPPPNDEFSERPFLAGELLGLRSFNLDSLSANPHRMHEARLQGVSYNEDWVDGENVAQCHNQTAIAVRDLDLPKNPPHPTGSNAFAFSFRAKPIIKWAPDGLSCELIVPPESPGTHRVAQLGCTCGYYAYFDDRATGFRAENRPMGIIKGYGTVTVGSKGFRCEKATILALVPTAFPNGEEYLAFQQMMQRTYPSVQVFSSLQTALAKFPLSSPVERS